MGNLYQRRCFEYDFIVHPGGNPNVIKINYSYADKIELTANGELAITSRLGKLIEGKPHSFSASSNDAVRSNFVLQHNTLSFELGDYDKTQSLVIDPTLVWSRYAGGNLAESVNKVTDNMAFGSTLSTFGIATNGGFQTIFGGVMDAFTAILITVERSLIQPILEVVAPMKHYPACLFRMELLLKL